MSAGNNAPFNGAPLGQEWIANGFGGELISLVRGDKRPHRTGWREGEEDEKDLLAALAHGANLGLRTGKRYVAFDIEDTEHAHIVADELAQVFGAKFRMRRRANSESRAVLVRYLDPLDREYRKRVIREDNGRKIVEILADGQQLMVAGIHPSGELVTWHGSTGKSEDLPVVDYDGVDDVIELIRKRLEREGVKLKPEGGANTAPGTAGTAAGSSEECDEDELARLVRLIPNDENFNDRDEWVRMGHAIFGASGGSDLGKRIWTSWSNQVPQDPPDEPERVWGSFRTGDTRSGAGYLRQQAQRASPNQVAADEFDDIAPDACGPVNPGTKLPRWLARDVMRLALQEDSSGKAVAFELPRTLSEHLARVAMLERPAPIIEGFCYPGIVHGVIAAPGVGKSLFALHCVASAASGVKPRDGKGFDTTNYAHIVALFGEDTADETGDRLRACLSQHATAGQPRSDLIFHLFENSPLGLAQIGDKGQLDKAPAPGLIRLCDVLEVIVQRHKEIAPEPGVCIVFDMLRHAFFGDENKRDQVDALFRVWKGIMVAVERAGGPPIGVVFLHHKTKAASRSGDTGFTSSGSIRIEGNARRITELQAKSGEFIEAKVTKANSGTTGAREYWKKQQVPSAFDPNKTTVILMPCAAHEAAGGDGRDNGDDFHREALVQQLHAWATSAEAKPITTGRTIPKAFVSLAEAIRGLPEGQSATDADVEAVRKMAMKVGAFKGGINRKIGGVQCGAIFDPQPLWKPDASPLPTNAEVGE